MVAIGASKFAALLRRPHASLLQSHPTGSAAIAFDPDCPDPTRPRSPANAASDSLECPLPADRVVEHGRLFVLDRPVPGTEVIVSYLVAGS